MALRTFIFVICSLVIAFIGGWAWGLGDAWGLFNFCLVVLANVVLAIGTWTKAL